MLLVVWVIDEVHFKERPHSTEWLRESRSRTRDTGCWSRGGRSRIRRSGWRQVAVGGRAISTPSPPKSPEAPARQLESPSRG